MSKLMPKFIGGVGEKKSNGGRQFYQQDRVYSTDGVAMCLPAMITSYLYLVEECDGRDERKTEDN